MEAPLTDLQAQLSSLLDSHREPAVLLSPEYTILAANRSYQQLYGGARQVLGSRCFSASHGYSAPCDQAGELCPLQACQRTGERQRVLHLHRTSQGEEHVDVELTPIRNHKGEVVFFLEKMVQVKAASTLASDQGLVGRSSSFNRMLELLQRVAPSEASVLLQGESGTGKELVASAIHQLSRRVAHSFVTVECSGLPESLFESELFGYEKGAFTGAASRKTGLVEAARGGTLFLDEIGDIPPAMQVKLLRLIESGTYRTVGGVELKHADFRLICATHRNLKAMVAEGSFRQDLYYRIAVFPVHLPSLSERRDDLELLITTLLRRICADEHYEVSDSALQILQTYAFPGNIRELRNILERGVLLADHGIIEPRHLPDECFEQPEAMSEKGRLPTQIRSLPEVELDYLRQLLPEFAGNYKGLAEQLGISERTLYRKIRAIAG